MYSNPSATREVFNRRAASAKLVWNELRWHETQRCVASESCFSPPAAHTMPFSVEERNMLLLASLLINQCELWPKAKTFCVKDAKFRLSHRD
ncbi:hypothetical protein L596_003250 [Steinernema carpocapsae]|uniref:Uncharacterized protein n=1 Tax=Steinernema carpocapsae TaxID=34508 RepID=A0A4U8URV8_STECR|nr:hypothetical protein L596_003250 [Steinernema carpocapsae]